MSFYITTPIYYVNDVPHLGHAYTTIAADALYRFHRSRGEDSYFLTGTDEHGQKIEDAAKAKKRTPLEHADAVVERFESTWVELDIANDDFIRTTEERHKRVVADMWKRLEAADKIYLGAYEGWYCVSCEQFYTEGQLEGDGDSKTCPIHKTRATWLEEPSYFFKMSEYAEPLLQHIADNPEFIQPESYRREVVSFVEGGLRDLSVSRTSFKWGVPVPGDEDHIIYVWIDALTNYISALGGVGSEAYERYWPAVHLIGKDILRFHAVYWPTMLLAAGLPLPRTIFAHGWWTVRGEKISKSMPATRVDPVMLAADVGPDALRYYLLREIPLGNDGDFSYEGLIGRYNSDLANDLGNLLNRALTMTAKFCGGKVPAASAELGAREPHAALGELARQCAREAAEAYESFAVSRALEIVWRLVRETNRYIDTCQPWKLGKDASKADELAHVTHAFLEAIFWAARMAAPVMPRKAAEVAVALGQDERAIGTWPSPEDWGSELPVGAEITRGEPLFPRIDDERQAALLARWIPDDAAVKTASADDAAVAHDGLISFDEFQRLDLRVAEIVAAEPVPKTSKLLRLEVSLGEETRQVVAGIAASYRPEELVGRKVIFVANLKPARIRGVTSEGMVLAAGDKEILGLSALDKDVPAGTVIR